MRARKRRLLRMLRAYRAAAAALPDAVVVVERNDASACSGSTKPPRPCSACSYPRRIGEALIVTALQPLPMAHWLAAGRNAEPMIDVAVAGEPGPAPAACA